jgi:hypothetical protein
LLRYGKTTSQLRQGALHLGHRLFALASNYGGTAKTHSYIPAIGCADGPEWEGATDCRLHFFSEVSMNPAHPVPIKIAAEPTLSPQQIHRIAAGSRQGDELA